MVINVLVFQMNKTRREWSVTYKCCKGKRDRLTAFYSLASAVFVIALSFYGAVYFVGSKDADTEVLDERQILIRRRELEDEPSSADPSTSIGRVSQPEKKLIINQEDSDDDEILTGSLPKTLQQNPNLIALDNWNKLHAVLIYLLYILFNVIVESKKDFVIF